MELIDTHAHLDEDAFAVDLDDVIRRAHDAGVAAIITIGTTAATSTRAIALAQEHPHVYACVGIQPNYAAAALPGDFETIEQLARAPKVVGIGETGLDRYWDYAPFDLQEDYFRRHIDLARSLNLPFVVHCREADDDVVRMLETASHAGTVRGVMHSFSGSRSTAEKCVALGLHVSFAGMLTFKKSDALRQTAAAVPLDRLLVETDAPYLAPTPYRGKRNEPAFVVHTAMCLAQARGTSLEEIAAHTTKNARALFGI